jgi:hypothetical protein
MKFLINNIKFIYQFNPRMNEELDETEELYFKYPTLYWFSTLLILILEPVKTLNKEMFQILTSSHFF